MVRQAIVTTFILLVSFTANAQTVIKETVIAEQSTKYTDSDSHKQWDISAVDWNRYKTIMDGKGKYLWKDLDPITVLGLNSRTPKELDKFAELLAKLEFENTRKLIELDGAYSKAFSRLYGNLEIIDTSKLTQTNSLFSSDANNDKSDGFIGDAGDRYILFASTNCSQCNEVLNSFRNDLRIGVGLDIHFANNQPIANINKWARNMKISVDSVKNKIITLNPNSPLFAQFKNPSIGTLYFYNKSENVVNEVKQ